jgi:DNA-binding IclR family transcriptional regulator
MPERDGGAVEHRTVSRVAAILEAVAAESEGMRFAPLAERLGAAKSSVHGLVKGLVAIGYLREEGGVYRLGPAFTALLGAGRPDIAAAARPVMEELWETFDETVMLGMHIGDSVVYVETLESRQLIRYSAPRRLRRPLYPTSTGKCFLAYLPPRRRDGYLDARIEDPAQRELVRQELERVRRDGFAVNRGETLPDISAAASPILRGEQPLACIAVAGPTTRMGSRLDEIGPVVRDAVQTVGSRLTRAASHD